MKDERPRELAILSQAYRALAEAQTIEEVKGIRDKAEAARKYAQCVMLGLEIQNRCAEIKLRSERKAGKLLSELHLCSGRPAKKKRSQNATILKDLGINKSQSSRWQMEAEVPEDLFNLYLTVMRKQAKEVTTQGLLRLAQQHQGKSTLRAPFQKPPSQRRTKLAPSSGSRQPNGRGAKERLAEAFTLLTELLDHRKLLQDLLEEFCKHETVQSQLIQHRTVTRLLSEMEVLLTKLGKTLRATMLIMVPIVPARNSPHRRSET